MNKFIIYPQFLKVGTLQFCNVDAMSAQGEGGRMFLDEHGCHGTRAGLSIHAATT